MRFSLFRWIWDKTSYGDGLSTSVAEVGRLFVVAVFWLSGFVFVLTIAVAVFVADSLKGWPFFAGGTALIAVVAGWQLLRNRPNPLILGIIAVIVMVPVVLLVGPGLGVGVMIAATGLGTTVAVIVKPRTAVAYLIYLGLVVLVVLVATVLIRPSTGLDVVLGVVAAVPSIAIAGLIYDLVNRRSRFTKERLEQVIANAADAIIGIDGAGAITLFNDAAETLFGYDSAGTVGLPFEMLVPERFSATLPSRVVNFANRVVGRGPRDKRMILTGLKSDGTEFPIQVSISKSKFEGKPEFTAIVHDMTQVERTRKELEELLASKDRLIASVSHEFRTPLTAVVGFARLLQAEAETSGQPNSERSEMIEIIVNQGNDLTNMVEDLLVVAKAETGSLVFVSVSVDIRAQSIQVIEALGERQTGNITFSGDPVRGIGDPARVRQVVRNLISNALRYGGGEAEVTFDKHENTARVQVIDSGPGVPPEDRERIFLRYQRAHTDLGITEAMGLGLTISRDLARGMGGDVTYRRVDDKTIFELRLPAAD